MIVRKAVNINGTHFTGTVINATVNELINAFGEPDYKDSYLEKVQNEWIFRFTDEFGEDHPITLYDWKEYRTYSKDEVIEWHLGGLDGIVVSQAAEDILEKLRKNN